LKKLALLFLIACGKKAPPPPVVVVDASTPPAVTSVASSARTPTCEPAETRIADLFVVKGWMAAYEKAAGFEEEKAASEADAKKTLCRMDVCSEAPPWIVKAQVTPHPFPTNVITPVSGERLAVIRVGLTGAEICEGQPNPVNRLVTIDRLKDEVVVFDEEVTPLRRAPDGCDQAGPPVRSWHVVDTRSKKEWVFRGDVVDVAVEPKEIVAKKAGCSEIRYSR
jgi:hypothetical protein